MERKKYLPHKTNIMPVCKTSQVINRYEYYFYYIKQINKKQRSNNDLLECNAIEE